MSHFIGLIYKWYEYHRRELPWRLTSDPYLIWVSETILQQTRVKQGLPYYNRFIRHFPDVSSLAAASGDELMKIWEGLGYYSRARNMHDAAKAIESLHGGKFPDKYEEIRNLKGVGDYAAAAVASIAFGLPYAVADGNVFRFLTRYLGIQEAVDTTHGKRLVRQTAEELLNTEHPGYHNEALMEFGALCCIPKKPDCPRCPVQPGCFAFHHGMVNVLPVKSKKTVRKNRYFYFYVPEDEWNIIIEKRIGRDIWKNLYQFPLYEPGYELTENEILSNAFFKELIPDGHGAIIEISPVRLHELTHQQIRARFITIFQPKLSLTNSNHQKISKEEIHKFAFPALIRNFLEEKITRGQGRS